MNPAPKQRQTCPSYESTCEAINARRRGRYHNVAASRRRRRQVGKKNVSMVPDVQSFFKVAEAMQIDPAPQANDSFEVSDACPIKVTSSATQWLMAGLDEKSHTAQPQCAAQQWLSEASFAKKGRPARHVEFRFNLALNTVHEVTPYGEIYGRRPCTFVFERDGCMMPAAPCGFVSWHASRNYYDDEDSEEEEATYFSKWQ